MRRFVLSSISTALILSAWASGAPQGHAQGSNVMVFFVQDVTPRPSTLIKARKPDDNSFIRQSSLRGGLWPRGGLCLFTDMPARGEIELSVYGPRVPRVVTVQLGGYNPWSGPIGIRLSQAVPKESDGTLALLPSGSEPAPSLSRNPTDSHLFALADVSRRDTASAFLSTVAAGSSGDRQKKIDALRAELAQRRETYKKYQATFEKLQTQFQQLQGQELSEEDRAQIAQLIQDRDKDFDALAQQFREIYQALDQLENKGSDSGERLPQEEAFFDDLKAIQYLAQSADPLDTDAVYWSLKYLQKEHAKDPQALQWIQQKEANLKANSETSALFDTPAAQARYELFGKLVDAAWGEPVQIPPETLSATFRNEATLPAARDAALRVYTDKKLLDEQTWRMVADEAVDSASPLLYAANYACAKSTDNSKREVVRRGVSGEDPLRFTAAVEGARDAKADWMSAQVLERSPALTNALMKTGVVDYLGSQSGSEAVNALGRYLDDPDPQVQLWTAFTLRDLQKSGRASLSNDAKQKLNCLAVTGLHDPRGDSAAPATSAPIFVDSPDRQDYSKIQHDRVILNLMLNFFKRKPSGRPPQGRGNNR